MALAAALLEALQRPTIGDMVIFMAPIWVAVVVGVLVGWAWKPKWANGLAVAAEIIDLKPRKGSSEFAKGIIFERFSCLNSLMLQLSSYVPWVSGREFEQTSSTASSLPSSFESELRSSEVEREKPGLLNENDLKYLSQLVDESDGGPAWIQMMDRSTSNMSYQAWRRDPETGPPQYRSRTVFEDATPETVRDFFWDDEFRMKWDDMLVHAETLEESPSTGTMVVQWVRKFPFFCSDREYIIGRRIWKVGQSYYCVTKGVPCSNLPRHNKPRRVDLYYSSWCIRAVESKRDGHLPACEVLLFHYEDMGIPWEIAKLGVRQGMWGAVRKIDPGLRAYQKHRASGAPLSRCTSIAQINTKVSEDSLRSLESPSNRETETLDSVEKPPGRNIPKLLVVGGAIALACSLDRGLLTKTVIFGVARRFANIGGRRL